MSAFNDITVFDGAATPVSHLLKAIRVQSKPDGTTSALWAERLVGVPFEGQVTVTIDQKVLNSGVTQTITTADVPVMESISGQNSSGYTAVPAVAFVERNRWVNYKHPRSTVTTARLGRMILTNISNNISTTVAAATTGPFAEAVDQVIMPG